MGRDGQHVWRLGVLTRRQWRPPHSLCDDATIKQEQNTDTARRVAAQQAKGGVRSATNKKVQHVIIAFYEGSNEQMSCLWQGGEGRGGEVWGPYGRAQRLGGDHRG